MISAIAARKSAQAALQGQAEIIYDVPPSPGEQPPPTASPNLPQKRKQSLFHTTKLSSTIKRRRRSGKMTRNLESDEFRSQNDVIVIESDEDEKGQPVPSDESLDDSEIEILPGPPPQLSKDRAWSPSMPPDDSSSSDKETFDTSDLIHVPSRFSRPAVPGVGKTLSTFIPVPDKNVYYLLAKDLASTAISGEKGTIVILEQGDSLSLLGTCRLTLLKGAITLNGVHLQPSLIPHRIFSPRSSPLVMIEGSSGTKCVVDISSIPSRLHRHEQSKSALVFFQELPTAVEGLGRICRTFEGVYESHGRQDHSISSPFQLSGLYMVRYFVL
jgi:polynucleotide 5'-hydroxyl-kinase GRC3/NOL9